MSRECVWADGLNEKMNTSLIFLREVCCDKFLDAQFSIAAATNYKLIINGKSVFCGPMRTAEGFSFINSFSFTLSKGKNSVAFLVNSYGAASYSHMKRKPFLCLSLKCGKTEYDANDFACFEFKERIKNSQRYSFQRGFSEIYKQKEDFSALIKTLLKENNGLKKKKVSPPEFLEEDFLLSPPAKAQSGEKISGGIFEIDESLPDWKDRSIYGSGKPFDMYPFEELYECITKTTRSFAYLAGTKNDTQSGVIKAKEYGLWDFKRNVSGFISLRIKVKKQAQIYLTFDEILLNGIQTVNPVRLDCCNVIKWELEAGEYTLETFEIYTCRYAQINILSGEVEVLDVKMLLAENSNAYNLKFSIQDERLSEIIQSAQNTLAQNSFDLLTDCPSRERACWINDLYYIAKSEEIFFGSDKAGKLSLENVIRGKQLLELPLGMTPMCYPSDHINGDYIPNCGLWFVLNVCRSILEKKDFNLLNNAAKERVYGVLNYFLKYENEDELIESLPAWIFIEWSVANDKNYVSGVNYPSNMLYYKALKETSKAFGDEVLSKKADRIKAKILEQSFNGEFFEDNRVRENGSLTLKGHISEACQYFAFFSDVADVNSHNELYNTLINYFGPFRNKEAAYPQIGSANIITGLLKRLDLLLNNGECDRVIEEVVKIFLVMAKATKTLWENVTPRASCNHGIASYGGSVLIRALTGLIGYENNVPIFSDNYSKKYNCKFDLPCSGKYVSVSIKDGKREIIF